MPILGDRTEVPASGDDSRPLGLRDSIRKTEKYIRLKARRRGGWRKIVLGSFVAGLGWATGVMLPGGFWSDLTGRFTPPDLVGAAAGATVLLGLYLAASPILEGWMVARARREAEREAGRLEHACGKTFYVPLSLRHATPFFRPGLTFGYDVESGGELFVPDERLRRHTLVMGGTGTGKSSFLTALAFQQMLRGGGLIFVDAKRDTEAMRRFAWMARVADRLGDFRLIDLGGAHVSRHNYNPLKMSQRAEEWAANLAGRIFQSMPPVDQGSDAQHYRELIYENLVEIAAILLATRKSFSVEDIQYILRYPEESFLLLEEDLKAANDYEALKRLHRFRLSHWGQGNQRINKWQADMSTLTGALGRLMADEFKEAMLVSASGEVDLDEVFRKRQIVYFALPWMTKAESCQGLMRIFLTHLQQVIGARAEAGNRGDGDIPHLVILDEFGSYAQPGFAEVVRMGRSAGAALFLVVQTFSRLADRNIGLNENFARDVMNNCRSLVVFSIQDPRDAETVVSRWGEKYHGQRVISVSTSEGESEEKAGIKKMANPRQTVSQGLSEGMREVKELVVPPEVVSQHLGWVRDGKGRAVLECDSLGPRVADTAWADVEPPEEFNVATAIPRLPSPGAVQPLGLAARVDALLSPPATRNGAGKTHHEDGDGPSETAGDARGPRRKKERKPPKEGEEKASDGDGKEPVTGDDEGAVKRRGKNSRKGAEDQAKARVTVALRDDIVAPLGFLAGLKGTWEVE